MSPLYGRLRGEPCRKAVTRRGFESVDSVLETWEGSVQTTLARDGTYTVEVGPKHGPREPVVSGNVNEPDAALEPDAQDYPTEGAYLEALEQWGGY